MPPTNLTVDFNPASPEAALRVVRDVIPQAELAAITSALDPMSNDVLHALATGMLMAEDFGLSYDGGKAITEDQWRGLIVAYAQATLVDRQRSNDRNWQLLYLLIGGVVGSITTLLGVLASHRLKDRERNKDGQASAGRSKYKHRRR